MVNKHLLWGFPGGRCAVDLPANVRKEETWGSISGSGDLGQQYWLGLFLSGKLMDRRSLQRIPANGKGRLNIQTHIMLLNECQGRGCSRKNMAITKSLIYTVATNSHLDKFLFFFFLNAILLTGGHTG